MEFTLVTTFLAILSVKKISAQNSIQRSDLKAASGCVFCIWQKRSFIAEDKCLGITHEASV